jgi:hypothetical protein
MAGICADGFGEDTRDKFVCATRARHRNLELVLPVECAPRVAAAEEKLKLLIGGNGFRLREVSEPVKGELDLVTQFVGASNDSVKGFANLGERRDEPFARNGKPKRARTAAHRRTWVWSRLVKI